MDMRIVENKIAFTLQMLRRPTRQRGNRRFVLNPRIAHLASFYDSSQLFPQQKSMPKRKQREGDKRSQGRQNEQPSNKSSRNDQKASGEESAIQLPMTNRCSAEQGNAGKMGSSASIQNAAKAAKGGWHEEEEGC